MEFEKGIVAYPGPPGDCSVEECEMAAVSALGLKTEKYSNLVVGSCEEHKKYVTLFFEGAKGGPFNLQEIS